MLDTPSRARETRPMSDDLMRRILAASAVFNLGGALMFLFPDSVGRLAALPSPVPLVYRVLVALFVVLFGGMYAWLSTQRLIVRPMVVLAAVGKASAFFATVGCWLVGAAAGIAVVAITGDLAFAALFTWWLLTASPGATARS